MKPLVSILIHNYNYGRYLDQCLESVFSQSYQNIEVVFADNASTDLSWEVAEKYANKYPGKITLIRQKKNRGPEYNSHTVWQFNQGNYFCLLCSDDALQPGFIEKTVAALEAHPKASFAMVHRAPMDADGIVSVEAPFYKYSCVIPGKEQAAVYMMSSCAPCISQMMYRASAVKANNMGLGAGSLTSRWFGPRILDFNLCLNGDMIYLSDPLILHRIHSASDSSHMLETMLEPIGQYILIHQLAEVAKANGGMDNVVNRLPDAIKKLARLCLRYAMGAAIKDDQPSALDYLYLARVINPSIRDHVIESIFKWAECHESDKKKHIDFIFNEYQREVRTSSYDPPKGSLKING